VRAAPFWIAAAGGVLFAAGSAVGSTALELLGAVVFVLGVVSFFAAAVQRSRDDGIGVGTALARGAQDALRFAWRLMP